MNDTLFIPTNIIIESVFGCNANCVMCPIDKPTKRKKGVMSFDLYKDIIDGLYPYRDKVSQLDLFGVGEPLLDKTLPEKIQYAKQKGFCGIGIATNADLMDESTAQQLFEAGLDTIMVSIDGITKAVHESIRVNTNFERIVKNVKRAISLRDSRNYTTKFVLRFIRQLINRDEWKGFKEYWNPLICREKADKIIGYDIHSWGGEVDIKKEELDYKAVPGDTACHHLFDRLIILNDGTVPLCCADMNHAHQALGNVKDSSPIEIYNNSKIKEYRQMHLDGNRLKMTVCTKCTILESESVKDII